MTTTVERRKLQRGGGGNTMAGSKGTAVAGRKRLDPKEGDEGLIGQHLESLVKASGLTVDKFAERIGKDKDTVILYFGGHRLPKLKDFRVIAEALELSSLQEVLPDLPIAKRRRKS